MPGGLFSIISFIPHVISVTENGFLGTDDLGVQRVMSLVAEQGSESACLAFRHMIHYIRLAVCSRLLLSD